MSREMSIAELAAAAAATEDQTETKAGGDFEREVIPEGINFARFVGYIETGKHPSKPYMGKEKPPAEVVYLNFELLHPKKSIIEYEVDGQKKQRGQMMTIRLKKSLSDKAGFKKLFNAMVYGRDTIKHFTQMLGEPFLVTVHHNKQKKDDKEIIYANLNTKEGVWSVGAPRHTDPISGTTTDLAPNIPMPFAPVRIFLWNNPTKTTWDSLFIDGTREVKGADGEVTHQSKNWLQEQIMSAINFGGSPLEAMLHDVSDLPITEDKEQGKAEVSQTKSTTTSPSDTGTLTDLDPAPVEQKTEVKKEEPAKETSASDALAALGLM